MKRILLLICFGLLAIESFATTYYCDPAKGSMHNKGTYKSPWSSLDSVFLTRCKLLPGDTILLRTGYHGLPIIRGNLGSTSYITILPQAGHKPTVKKIIIDQAKYWKISGLKVSPEVMGSYEKGDLVAIKASASFISIANFAISSTDSCINNWSAAKLVACAGLGIRVEGKDCIISNNTIRQVTFGINVSKSALRTLVSGNIIYGFLHDGMRGLSDDSIFEYNLVAGCYAIDNNHDDGFQSWSTDENGKVGMGKVSNVTLRGNVFISQLDPEQPFPQEVGMQGIGCFDGYFENWTIENNIVITNMWHGISFYGAKNVKIANNTVLSNPLQYKKFTPWIGFYNHKKLGESSNNTVINNLTTGFDEMKGVITNLNNTKVSAAQLNTYFKDWKNFDIQVKSNKKSKVNGGADLTSLPKLTKRLYDCIN